MGDIILKFQLKDILNCIIEEDLSEYLKLKIKDKQYSAAYENDSIYKFEVPDTEKNFNFQLSLEHEDYDNKIYNTSESSLVYSNTVCNFINKYNIPVVYACKKSEKYTIIELKAYHLDDNFNKLFNDNYERYFYKANSLVELEVKLRDDKVVDDDQIQWGIISWHDLYSIEKENNHEFFSNEYSSAIQKELHEKFKSFSYDIIEKKGSRYICELPNYQQDEPHELYIFAYISEEEITKYNSVKLCINDYTQVVIDVTLAEALRADTEVAQLGWATSYVLQRLWHDNPRDAKEPDELILKDIKDVCKVTKNYKMKYILCHIDFDIKLTKEKISPSDSRYPFSVYLDLEKFYSKFSIVKDLQRYLDPIIFSEDFIKEFSDWISYCFKKHGFTVTDQSINYMLVINIDEINIGKTKNNDIFDITYYGSLHNINKNQGKNFLHNLTISDLNDNYMTQFPVSELYFVKLNQAARKEAVALYAVTGKFSLNFIPNIFSIKRSYNCHINSNYRASFKNMYGYVYDNFDFDDNPNQPVGDWDYKNMTFSKINSVSELLAHECPKLDFINSFVKRFDVDDSIITLYNRYYMNYRGVELSDNGKVNYKNNKIYKGLNFRVYSSKFFMLNHQKEYAW